MNHVNSTPDDVFRLGLSLAGSATAGAYLAGVMDFLLEAFHEWELAKVTRPTTVPHWRVSLSDIAGTSSGGITTSLTVAALSADFKPLPKDYAANQPSPYYNPLFSVWVDGMTYSNLLSCADLDETPGVVQSLLNAVFMRDVGQSALNNYTTLTGLPAFARDLHFELTVTNLRGVPYTVPNFAYDHDDAVAPRLRKHTDWVSFAVIDNDDDDDDDEDNDESGKAEEKEGVIQLNVSQNRTSDAWRAVMECTRATAAVPIAFPTVALTTTKRVYDARGPGKPHWKEGEGNATAYTYAATDGGMVDNEPFDLLLQTMRRRHGRPGAAASSSSSSSSTSSGDRGRRMNRGQGAVWLVDSFPASGGTKDPGHQDSGMSLVSTAGALFEALRGQASFKPLKVSDPTPLELNDDITKFLVYPTRGDAGRDSPKQPFVLAAGTLNQFGGMLHRKLRVHDYLLGRHNCQQYLRDKFTMTRAELQCNPIFAPYYADDDATTENEKNKPIPIIPLTGTAKDDCPLPEWPRLSTRERNEVVDDMKGEVEERLERMIDTWFANMGVTVEARINPVRHARNVAALGVRKVMVEFLSRKVMSEVKSALEVFAYEK